MSRYFEAVYFRLIKDTLKATQIKIENQSKSLSKRNKNQSINLKSQCEMEKIDKQVNSKTMINKDCQQSPENLEFNHLSNYRSGLLKAGETQIQNQSYQFSSMNSQIDPNIYQFAPLRHQIETKYNYTSEVFKIPNHSYNSQPSYKIQQTSFHADMQTSLIENASSKIKSQRLSMIFQSTRKQRDDKNRQKYFSTHSTSKRSKNSRLLNDMDERSIKNIRKSFCLSILENDQEWDEACSRSVKMKNDKPDMFD